MPQQKRTIDWELHGFSSTRSEDDSGDITAKFAQTGDTVSGKLAKVETVTTRYGDKTVIEIADVDEIVSDGQRISVDGHTVTVWPTPGLITELGKAEADYGQTITIELIDLKDTGKGHPFKVFEVIAR